MNLRVIADNGSIFAGWSGDCNGLAVCQVSMDLDSHIIATFLVDADTDTVPDALDNCPNTANTGQADTDNDGEGDACDVPVGGVTLEKIQLLVQGRGMNRATPYVNRGDTISYTLTAQNLFDTPMTFVIADALNAFIDYVSGTLQVNETSVSDSSVSDSGLLEYATHSVGVNDVVTIAFDVTVKADAAYDELVENVAVISAYAPWLQDAAVSNQESNGIAAQVRREQSAEPVPEPSTLAFFGIGLLGLISIIRKRKDLRE